MRAVKSSNNVTVIKLLDAIVSKHGGQRIPERCLIRCVLEFHKNEIRKIKKKKLARKIRKLTKANYKNEFWTLTY